jgi:lipopolysaccharide biosynthesis regulator YciM
MGTTLILAIAGLAILAVGVLIGRYYVPDDRGLKRSARHAEAYMRAIDHLLARNRDAAIDELRAVVAENVNKIEPYFALAALFRGRGECERAIRVHQAIALRKDSSKADKLRARYQLGLDFRAAGMPRRATRAMEQVVESDPKHLGALRALTGLYEEQGRFAEAAEMWTRLRKIADQHSPREAHLYAAAAQRAVEVDNVDAARTAVKTASKLAGDDPHVLAAFAEVEAARGNYDAAAERLRQALVITPQWAIYLVPALLEAERQRLGDAADDQAEDALIEQAARNTVDALEATLGQTGADPFLLIAIAELRSHFDPEGALGDFRDIAALNPELLPARVAAGRLALSRGEEGEIRDELIALVGPDGALSWALDGAWRCGHCGRRGDDFFWRCGGCRQWGSAVLDLGRAAQDIPIESPRERRAASRSRTLWGREVRALPEPSVVGEQSPEEAAVSMQPGILGRARRWLTSPFRRDG